MPPMSSRRPPFPHHALLDLGDGTKRGLLLQTDQRGTVLIGKKSLSLANAVPQDQRYGLDDLYRERSFAMRRLVLGMGERVQNTPTPARYRYARNCWFAGGLRGKGPQWHNLAPASTGSITDFAEALDSGVVTQFILAGRYVLKRTDDTSGGQTVSHDFGAARTVTSWARFKDPGGTDRLYVTLDNGDQWDYAAGTWTGPHASITAFLACVNRDEYWIKSSQNGVRKATASPTVAANFAAEITVGDGSLTITGLASVGGTLVIFMSNGKAFTLNGDGSENDLAAGLATSPAATNGSKPHVWLNPHSGLDAVYFRNGAAWRRLTVEGGANVEPVGPERLISNDSPVSGQAVCFAGYTTFYGFFATYNSSSGASHLLQFGDWIPRDDEDGFGYVETFNGALVEWTSRQVTAMRVQAISGVFRLYVGFSDGTYGWIKLPQNTPNPFAAMSGCEFADGGTGASECYWPTHTMLAEMDQKQGLSFAAFGPTLSTDNRVTIARALDGGSFTNLTADLVSNGAPTSLEAADVYRAMDVRETYVSPSSASTPVIESVVLREQLRPATRLEYSLTVDANPNRALRNGGVNRATPDQTHGWVRQAADGPGSTTWTLPDETVQGLTAVDYGEAARLPGKSYGSAWDVPVKLIQFKTAGTYGTIDRGGSLTIDGLGSMTIDERGTL